MISSFVAMSCLAPTNLALVFQDEFEVPGRPNPEKWNYEIGFIRNQEPQYYRPENAWVADGKLIIEGRREKVDNTDYESGSTDWRKNRKTAEFTSASVITRGKFSWQFGRLEVRAKIRPEVGLWPAIWTKGVEGIWPSCGEVDVMEFYRQQLHANTAYGDSQKQVWDSAKTPIKHFFDLDPAWSLKFHVWTMDWSPDSIRLAVDGELLNETKITDIKNPNGTRPFHQPHWLLLNLAIGATGGDTSQTEFPTRFEVDYVRIYAD